MERPENTETEEVVVNSNTDRQNFERPLSSGGNTTVSDYFNRHKKLLIYVGGGLLLVILGILAYRYFVIEPQNEEARGLLYKSQRYFEADSFNLALNGDGANPGMREIADDYGMTETGNLAKYYTGMALLQLGKYDEAIEYLEDFKTDSKIIEPIAYGGIGDAHSQLKEYDEAAKYYMKAAKADDNEFTAPRYYKKAGLVYEELGDFAGALDAYQVIKDKYGRTPAGMDIDKYIQRAKAHVDAK